MPVLEVLAYPDPRLRLWAEPIRESSPALRQLAFDMMQTLKARGGVGLAATQVDVQQRLLIMDMRPYGGERRIYINPEILESEGSMGSREGCLSVPGFSAVVNRAKSVRVRARTIGMKEHEEQLEGLAAACIQHEIDHLDGKLFIDRLSRQQRRALLRRYAKGKPNA